jgi:dihydrofolate reductase
MEVQERPRATIEGPGLALGKSGKLPKLDEKAVQILEGLGPGMSHPPDRIPVGQFGLPELSFGRPAGANVRPRVQLDRLREWRDTTDGRAAVGRIVVSEFVSLDGVMEDPGGSENTKHGGWTFAFNRGPEGDKFKLDEAMDSEALLLGRVTYEAFAAAWPSMEGEFADRFNGMPKYVVSSTLDSATWNNTTVLSGSVADEVSKLRGSLDGDIVVHGSGRLVSALVEHDLVDELRLMVFPIFLGSGRRLLGHVTDPKRFRLADTATIGDGVVILTYQP